jgi:transposase-like protein
MSDEPIIKLTLPDKPAMADVAVAMFRTMLELGFSEARAECPFCPRGYLHAGRFGNARRARVQCDDCGRVIIESFRSAYGMRQ